jgi:hypothetical protein
MCEQIALSPDQFLDAMYFHHPSSGSVASSVTSQLVSLPQSDPTNLGKRSNFQ